VPHERDHAFERHPGAASAPLPTRYRRRRPETTVLYRIVADHLETLLAQARERSAYGFGLPRHVERTFYRYLECGILSNGFCRVRFLTAPLKRSCRSPANCAACGRLPEHRDPALLYVGSGELARLRVAAALRETPSALKLGLPDPL